MVEAEIGLELKSFQEDNPDLLFTTDFTPFEFFWGQLHVADQASSIITGSPELFSDEFAAVTDWEGENDQLALGFIRLGGQAQKLVRDIRYAAGTWPTFDDAEYPYLFYYHRDFILGLRGKHITKIKDDNSTAATTLEDILAGMDVDGTGTNDIEHWQYIRRFAYWFGTMYRKFFPNLVDRLDSATETVRQRVEYILAARSAYECSWLPFMFAVQSDRAVMALGAMVQGMLSKKIDGEKLAVGSIDAAWLDIMKEHKYDSVDDNFASGASELGINADFFDFSVLDLSTLDDKFQRVDRTFRVPALAVNLARQLYGIGKYDNGNVTKHFIHLLNLVSHGDTTYTDHAISKWYAGVNWSVVLDLLEDARSFEEDWKALLEDRQHYTYVKTLKGTEDFFINFNFTESLNGFCDGDVYPALKRHMSIQHSSGVAAKTGTVPAATYYGKDPYGAGSERKYLTEAELISSNAWITAHATSKKSCAAWTHLYIWQGQDPTWRLMSYGELDSVKKIAMDFILGIIYDVTDADNVTDAHEEDQPHWYYHIYCNAIDARKKKKFGLFTNKTGVNVLRIEALPDVLCHYTGLTSFTHQYGLVISKVSHDFTPHWLAARPKIWDKEVLYVDNYGEKEVKLKLFDAMSALAGAQSPPKQVDKVKDDEQPKPKKEIPPAEKKPQPKAEVSDPAEGEPDPSKDNEEEEP